MQTNKCDFFCFCHTNNNLPNTLIIATVARARACTARCLRIRLDSPVFSSLLIIHQPQSPKRKFKHPCGKPIRCLFIAHRKPQPQRRDTFNSSFSSVISNLPTTQLVRQAVYISFGTFMLTPTSVAYQSYVLQPHQGSLHRTLLSAYLIKDCKPSFHYESS